MIGNYTRERLLDSVRNLEAHDALGLRNYPAEEQARRVQALNRDQALSNAFYDTQALEGKRLKPFLELPYKFPQSELPQSHRSLPRLGRALSIALVKARVHQVLFEIKFGNIMEDLHLQDLQQRNPVEKMLYNHPWLIVGLATLTGAAIGLDMRRRDL